VLGGLALHALVQITPIVNPPDLAQFFVGMGKQPRTFAAYGMRQKNFGIESRRGDVSFF